MLECQLRSGSTYWHTNLQHPDCRTGSIFAGLRLLGVEVVREGTGINFPSHPRNDICCDCQVLCDNYKRSSSPSSAFNSDQPIQPVRRHILSHLLGTLIRSTPAQHTSRETYRARCLLQFLEGLKESNSPVREHRHCRKRAVRGNSTHGIVVNRSLSYLKPLTPPEILHLRGQSGQSWQ